MNVFNKVTLQSMKKSRTRTFVTIIGVILSAAMITGVLTFGVSLLSYLTKGAIVKYGDWHVKFVDVDSSFVDKTKSDNSVKNTELFQNVGYAKLDGSKNPDKPYIFIAGFNDETFDNIPIKLMSGRLPENSSEIIISRSVTANGGVKMTIGDTLSLDVGNRMIGNDKLNQNDPYTYDSETFVPKEKKTYKVVGIYQRPCFEEFSAPGYTLITKADKQNKGDSFGLFVKLSNPREIHDYVNSKSEKHAYMLNDNVLRFMGLSEDKIINSLLYSIGIIVVVIIMIGSIFLIYNSFNISLNERTHQFGILSSVGATTKQLQNSVLFEGFCIGVIGIPIGVIVGIGCIKIVISVVANNFGDILYNNVSLTLTVSIPAIVSAAVVSMITILISAYIPARKAARTPVMECIRQTNDIKIQAKEVKISKLAQRIYGLEGTLALKNFKRNKKRYRSIVLSLALSVVLFISVNSFVANLKQSSQRALVFTTYDIGVDTKHMDDTEMLKLYDKLKTADGVYESSYQKLIGYSCTVKSSSLSDNYWKCTGSGSNDSNSSDEVISLPIEFQLLDDSTYQNIIDKLGLPIDEYTGENPKIIAVAKMTDNSKKGYDVSQFLNMFNDSSMNVTIVSKTEDDSKIEQGQNVNITFVDTVPPDTLPVANDSKQDQFSFRVMAPYSLRDKFETLDNNVEAKGLTFRSKSSKKSAEEIENMIHEAGVASEYNIYNMNDMIEENQNYIFIANVFAYTFIIMISLIAVANVFNTISTNIKLRRRELAMLRSVGMSEHDFQKMMNFECVFYGMKALFIGLPIAIISSWLIYKGMFIGGADDINFDLPWFSIGISVLSVLLIVFVTMLYSISKIKKENIIDALRDDMN